MDSYCSKVKGIKQEKSIKLKKLSLTIVGREYNENENYYSYLEIEKIIKNSIENINCENITIRTTGKTLTDFIAMSVAVEKNYNLELYLGSNFNLQTMRFDENEFDVNSDTFCKGIGCLYNDQYEQFKTIVPNVFESLGKFISYKKTRAFFVKEPHNVKKLLCKSDRLIVIKGDNDEYFDDLRKFYDSN